MEYLAAPYKIVGVPESAYEMEKNAPGTVALLAILMFLCYISLIV